MKQILSKSLVLVLFLVIVCSKTNAGSDRIIGSALSEISKKSLRVSDSALRTDMDTVRAATPRIRQYYPNKFSDDEIKSIIVSTYIFIRDTRQYPQDEPIDPNNLMAQARQFGKLIVSTSPEKASVNIFYASSTGDPVSTLMSNDERIIKASSNYRIKIEKNGYKVIDEPLSIDAGKVKSIQKTLELTKKPKQKSEPKSSKPVRNLKQKPKSYFFKQPK